LNEGVESTARRTSVNISLSPERKKRSEERNARKLHSPNSVRTTTNASNDRIRKLPNRLLHLRLDLGTDDRLEVANDGRERRGTDGGTDEVVRRGEVGDPVAHRLVCSKERRVSTVNEEEEKKRTDRILQSPRSARDSDNLRAQHPHPEHVQALPPHVLLTHVDDALEAELGADGSSRDTVLSGSSLGDDALLADTTGKEDLSDGVVDLW
jgi:hypothetical protein